jgi:hypothetical protein
MADNRVSYLNKTFSDFKNSLINYTKTYFPNSYNDFSDANPGAIFIDLAAYIGDVSSFYIDTQIQEGFLLYAKEKTNLYALSYMFGYRPKVSYASTVDLEVYQLIPAVIAGGITQPDYTYAVIIPSNTTTTSASTGTKFLTLEKVDFNDTTDTTITLTNDPNYYLLKKVVKAISAEIKSTAFTFTGPQKFQVENITDNNILQILDATDSDGNKWYEVPYLAQASVLLPITNPNAQSDGVPYLVDYQRIPRRYVSRFLTDNTLQLEFGAGFTNASDDTILPNPDSIQLGLIPGTSTLLNNYNKATPFFAQEYGLAPTFTTLTVRYLVGGGIQSNVPSNDIINVDKTNIQVGLGNLSGPLADQIRTSVITTNPSPAAGGRGGDEIEEIRNNALYAYQSQLRAVTREDYMTRALSMPTDYGSIAKVYVTQDAASEMLPTHTVSTMEGRNPLSLDMYILAYDSNKNITTATTTLKQNLAKYINQYRMVTDAVNIKDAFYINIGVNFDIVIQSGYNGNDVVTSCVTALQDHFNIDRWTINQPIILSDIISRLLKTTGVQSVVKLEIVNKQDGTGKTYSKYGYDISGATRQGNIYPSMDPSIFEIKYPNTDIQGRVVPFSI